MKLTVFSKEIEIDENNKGVSFYFDNIGTAINEITVVFWYKTREHLATGVAAEKLRKMTAEQLKDVVLQNIRDAIVFYEFDEKYANYV